jgi:hypothetical protein
MKNILFLILFFSILTINAQDRLFTYTYQTNVLNKGQKELEVWTTMKNVRENFYRAFNHKLEFEIGLGSRLQTAFYLNYGYLLSIKTENNIESLNSENSYSFANEWKLKLTDPVVNPIGSALYFEYTLGTEETAFEGKVLLDKQIGKTTQAFNIVGEYAIVNDFTVHDSLINIKKEQEINLELIYGFSYNLNKNLSFGFELFNKNRIEENKIKYAIFSAGPCLSYNIEGFWINVTYLPQITNLKTGSKELLKNELMQTRLIFSYVF